MIMDIIIAILFILLWIGTSFWALMSSWAGMCGSIEGRRAYLESLTREERAKEFWLQIFHNIITFGPLVLTISSTFYYFG